MNPVLLQNTLRSLAKSEGIDATYVYQEMKSHTGGKLNHLLNMSEGELQSMFGLSLNGARKIKGLD